MRLALVALATAAIVVSPLRAAGSTEKQIPGGVDTIPQTMAQIDLQFVGAPGEVLTLTGSTTVQRGAQSGDTIPTEMLAFDLSGQIKVFNDVPVKVRAGREFGGKPVTGAVENVVVDQKGQFVGGDSYFVFTELFLSVFGQRESHFRFDVNPPLRVEARITSLPPNQPRTTLPALGGLDHYKCYAVKGSGFRTATVKLADQFESEQAALKRPLTLCAPVSKNRAKIRLAKAHLKCYEISSTSAKPKKDEVTVSVTNQFGSQDLVVLAPRTLCAPTLKQRLRKRVPKPAPPRGALPAIDHVKCYDVRAKAPLRPRTVSLEDQFEIERAAVLQPVSLCAPVEKNGVKIRDSATHLVCYTIRDVSRKLKAGGRLVVVRNQFGVEVLTVGNPLTLCVPSQKEPPCSEYAERAKAQLMQQGQVVGTINTAIHRPFHGVAGSPCE